MIVACASCAMRRAGEALSEWRCADCAMRSGSGVLLFRRLAVWGLRRLRHVRAKTKYLLNSFYIICPRLTPIRFSSVYTRVWRNRRRYAAPCEPAGKPAGYPLRWCV